MIVVDASGVPAGPSGVRTRLRGLYEAYARIPDAPAVTVGIAAESRLFEGCASVASSSAVAVAEVPAAPSPLRRVFRSGTDVEWFGETMRQRGVTDRAQLWHAENLPGSGPRGVPVLMTLHDLRWFRPRREVGGGVIHYGARALGARMLQRRWARSWAGVVTVSEASQRQIVTRLGVPEEQVFVVANARWNAGLAGVPPLDDAARRARLGAMDPSLTQRAYYLAVGHLERRKGLERALAAIAGVSDDALLVLVGTGRDRRWLEREIARNGVSERVRTLGRRSDEEVANLIDGARALLFPSHVEGFGFPVFEAIQRGCPVVCSPLACLNDVRSPAVRRVDPGGWSGALQVGEAEWTALRDEARVLAEQSTEFDWNRSARELVRVYRRWLE